MNSSSPLLQSHGEISRWHRPKNKSRPTTRQSFRQASKPGTPEPGSPYDLLAQRKLAIVGHSAAASGRRDGKPYANTYSWFLDLRDGKIVKHSPSSTASRSTSSGNASSRSLEIRQVSLIKAYCVAACAGGTTLTYRTFSDSLTRERVFDA
jgi:hypothetical protein